MSSDLQKTLSFAYADLPEDTHLVLFFGQQGQRDFAADAGFIAWKTLRFRAKQRGVLRVLFDSQLAFGHGIFTERGILEDLVYVLVKPGDSVALTDNGFSEPENEQANGQLVKLTNKTAGLQTFTIGFVHEDDYQPTHSFSGIGIDITLEVDYRPVLRACVARDVQSGGIIDHQALGEVIFEQDLRSLSKDTAYKFSRSPTGEFKIHSTSE